MSRNRRKANAIKRLTPKVRERAVKKALSEGYDQKEISFGELEALFDFQGRIIGIRRNYGPF